MSSKTTTLCILYNLTKSTFVTRKPRSPKLSEVSTTNLDTLNGSNEVPGVIMTVVKIKPIRKSQFTGLEALVFIIKTYYISNFIRKGRPPF
jgi:hypothetical protein